MSLRKVPFTSLRLSSLKCPAGTSQIIYWDTKTPNLGLRVTKSQNKAYVFEAWFNGKSLRITIGQERTWTISAAQAEARRLKVLIDQGIDPREEKADLKAAVEAKRVKAVLALDVWQNYVKDRSTKWGTRHMADHHEMVREGGQTITRGRRAGMSLVKEQGMLRELLNAPLPDITRDRVALWLKKESAKRPTRARLALALLRAFIAWAGDQPKYREFVHTDACERLSRDLPSPTAKDDCLQKEQLRPWFEAVKRIHNPVISVYLQALLLTGARRDELASLQWQDLDTVWHTATIKDKANKTAVKTRQIPLTPYVESLLLNLPRKNEWVFSSPTAKSGRIQEPRIAHKQAIEAMGLPTLTIHGLRRSFGTLAEWVECPAGISAQIMGHKPSATAEKHYRVRPIDLLRKWHTEIEKFILTEAGIEQLQFGTPRLRQVGE
jgi:integrase